MIPNTNYKNLKDSYLFYNIAQKTKAYLAEHPGQHLYRMGIGDVSLPLCDAVIKKLYEAVEDQAKADTFHGYMPECGAPFLREAIRDHYAERGVSLSADEVFVSSGASDELGDILDLFGRDKTVMIMEPAYPAYVDANIMSGNRIVRVDSGIENGFLPMPSDVAAAGVSAGAGADTYAGEAGAAAGSKAGAAAAAGEAGAAAGSKAGAGAAAGAAGNAAECDNAVADVAGNAAECDNAVADVDVIYICSPNNPTGAVYNREQLQEWVDYANEKGAIILFDAAYEAFIEDESLPHSIFELEGARTCAIEICSLSKTAGFTGTRCGYTVIPFDLIREELSLNAMWVRNRTTKTNGVSYILQKGASAVFTPEGQRQIHDNIKLYKQNAQYLMDALDRAGVWYTGGKNAPYIWMKCPDGMDSWTLFDRLLNEIQVVGTPGEGFGHCGDGFFRFSTFGSPEDTIEAAERLLRFLLQN